MLLPILQINSDDIPENAVVCGDPDRALQIGEKLNNVKELAFSREYRTLKGEYKGISVVVVSHGVGSPGAAVCFEELIKAGVKNIIRVGTAGSYSGDIRPGSLVISTAAVREEGLTKQLVPIGYPAVADSFVVYALNEAAKLSGVKAKSGITLTLDAFYSGVEEFPHQKYKKAGVIAVEMETSALYVVSSLRRIRAGAILAIDGFADDELAEVYNPHNDIVKKAVDAEIKIALDAITLLSAKLLDN